MDDDNRIALEQEIADLRCALRQATDRASLAEVKCSQLLAAGRLADHERVAIEAAINCADLYDEEMDGFASGVSATLRGLLDRLGGT